MDKAQVQKSPAKHHGKQSSHIGKTRASRNKHFNGGGNVRSLQTSNLFTANHLSTLHHSLGNQAVGRMIQAKLTIGEPDDKYEREADQVADKVMLMPEPANNDDGKTIQTKPLASQITSLVQRVPVEQPDEDESMLQMMPEEMPEKEEEETVAAKLLVQRQPQTEGDEEEEPVQTKLAVQRQADEDEEAQVQTDATIQRQMEGEEEESAQAMPLIQRQVDEQEEEGVQAKHLPGHSAGLHVQRVCAECEEEMQRQPVIQPKGVSGLTSQVSPSVAANIHSMNSGGKPLPRSARSFFEPRFGADFSGVRVHTDTRSAETAKSINARAFTVGRNIAFGAGEYAPETQAGRRLLGHELTHVMQQKGEGQRIQRDDGWWEDWFGDEEDETETATESETKSGSGGEVEPEEAGSTQLSEPATYPDQGTATEGGLESTEETDTNATFPPEPATIPEQGTTTEGGLESKEEVIMDFPPEFDTSLIYEYWQAEDANNLTLPDLEKMRADLKKVFDIQEKTDGTFLTFDELDIALSNYDILEEEYSIRTVSDDGLGDDYLGLGEELTKDCKEDFLSLELYEGNSPFEYFRVGYVDVRQEIITDDIATSLSEIHIKGSTSALEAYICSLKDSSMWSTLKIAPEANLEILKSELSDRLVKAIQLEPLPGPPPRVEILGPYSDKAVAEELYGDDSISIIYLKEAGYVDEENYSYGIIEVNYDIVKSEWKEFFSEYETIEEPNLDMILPLPGPPPRAEITGPYSDLAISEELYSDPSIPINHFDLYGSDYWIIEVNYDLLSNKWKPEFANIVPEEIESLPVTAGLEDLYETYELLYVNQPIGPPSALGALDIKFEKLLKESRFSTKSEFDSFIEMIRNDFEKKTIEIARSDIEEYSNLLDKEEKRYQNKSSLSKLHEHLLDATQETLSDIDYLRATEDEAALPLVHDLMDIFRNQMAAVALVYPLLRDKRLDKEALARADESNLQKILLSYISGQRTYISIARQQLNDPKVIYKLNILIEKSKEEQLIKSGGLTDLIIKSEVKRAKNKEMAYAALLATLQVALIVLLPEAGALAVSGRSAAAFTSTAEVLYYYKEYESDKAYQSLEMMAGDASFVWVILAVVGAGIDLKLAVKTLERIRPLVKTLETTGEIKIFKEELQALKDIDAQIVKRIEAAAEAQGSYKTATKGLFNALTSGKVSANPFLDPDIYRALVKMAYYKAKQFGYTFQKFLLEIQKTRKLAKLGDMTPEELAKVEEAWEEANIARKQISKLNRQKLDRLAKENGFDDFDQLALQRYGLETTGLDLHEISGVRELVGRSARLAVDQLRGKTGSMQEIANLFIPARFGTRAHTILEKYSSQINRLLSEIGSNIYVAPEVFRFSGGNLAARRARLSIGIDVVIYDAGKKIPISIGVDLKTTTIPRELKDLMTPERIQEFIRRFGFARVEVVAVKQST